MGVETGQLIGGAVGGALVQSLLAPLVAQRGERRDVRATVLRHLSDVERARWAPTDGEEFKRAIVALRAAVLVAGGHRDVIDSYARLAFVARKVSDRSWDEQPDPEFGGGIPTSLSDLVRAAAELLVEQTWHPHRGRPKRRRGLQQLKTREIQVRERLAAEGERIDWEPSTVL